MGRVNGYVRLWRSIMDERIWANPSLLKVWLWALMKANHQDKTWMPAKCGSGITEVMVDRGQFIFGRFTASEELGMKPSTLRNRMMKLEALGFLDMKKDRKTDIKADRQWTLVTIRNYEHYSGHLDKEGQEEGQADGLKKDTTKELREKLEKSKKKIYSEGDPSREVAERILQFLNRKASRSYRAYEGANGHLKPSASLEIILDRLKQGATEAECQVVIGRKWREWGQDPKMAKFLRPITLFNRTNFNQYLGESQPDDGELPNL